MIDQDKKSELERISEQLSSLRESVNKVTANTKGYAEKRDKLNIELKNLRQEIEELRNQRDSMNQKVKILKQNRDDKNTKIKILIQEMQLHMPKIAELKKKISRKNRAELQAEFDKIEWKIQTTPLKMQEEKRLIDRVKQLETQLNIYKKIDQHTEKISNNRKEIDVLQTNVETAHQELTEVAERSQNVHKKMMLKIAGFKLKKTEADNFHRDYIQEIERTKPLQVEIRKLIKQKRKLKAEMQEEDEKRKKNAEQALKEKLGSQAKEKMQRGEKLSWNEFKLLEDQNSPD